MYTYKKPRPTPNLAVSLVSTGFLRAAIRVGIPLGDTRGFSAKLLQKVCRASDRAFAGISEVTLFQASTDQLWKSGIPGPH